MNRTLLVLALFVGAVVTGLLMRYKVTENFAQKEVGMPLDGPPMGPYDSAGMGWSGNEMPVGNLPVASALDQNKLMFMADNKTDPSCCPSAYSMDTGCVCLSGKDQDLLAHRGGNK
jgi:hypothetical protein